MPAKNEELEDSVDRFIGFFRDKLAVLKRQTSKNQTASSGKPCVEKGTCVGRGTQWKIYTFHLAGFLLGESHASSSQIRRSWNRVPCLGGGDFVADILREADQRVKRYLSAKDRGVLT